MSQTVFFSWQADTQTKSGRNFLKDAIEEACKSIAADASVDEAPRDLAVDSDTQGVAGQPPIVPTIFKKIDSCAVFVADMTFVGARKDGRLTPNPNVLVEYGWAMNTLGHERVISVMNAAHGEPSERDLPFNLRHVRWPITYNLPDASDAVTRAQQKKALVAILIKAIRASLSATPSSHPAAPVLAITDIIRKGPTDKVIHLRKHLDSTLLELDKLQPKMARDGGTAADVITALETTEAVSIAFAELAETVVLMSDTTSAKEIFQWFGKILARYRPPTNTASRTSNADGDFFRFVGNELFTTFVVPFLREGRFDQIREMLGGTLKVPPQQHRSDATRESWKRLSEGLPLLIDEGTRTRRLSVQNDILTSRHSKGSLAERVPLTDYQDADFFLFLHGPGTTTEKYLAEWYPRSVLLAKHTPAFVLDAREYPVAMRICHALQIADVEELKRRLVSSRQILRYDWQSPISDEDIGAIGSEGGAKIIT